MLNDLCYEYRYDGRGRLVEKKVPGKGLEYMVYDKADRVFLTQDANMRPSGNWVLTRYDKLSRIIYTAIAGIGSTYIRKDIQDAVDFHSVTATSLTEERTSTVGFIKSGLDIYYGNNTFPTNAILQVLSVNYYDTYPPGTPAIPTQILGQDVLSQDSQGSSVSTKSLPVASYVKNIEDDNWTKNYTWYDKKGRTIGTHSVNHLGGYTKTESLLDFAGVVLNSNTYHLRKQGEVGVTVSERFVYDTQNRLLQHFHQVDDKAEVLLTENSYNELSQLSNKKVGNNLQSIDYAYNIRGWMIGINRDQMSLSDLGGKLFSYKIRYNEKLGITNPDTALFSGKDVVPKYNGNIAEVDWKSIENIGNNPPSDPKRYGYAYDKLNRLTAGYYQNPVNPNSKENTESLTYDLNGNISSLFRTSVLEYGSTTPTTIDDLQYIYFSQNKSNKLITINDNSFNPTGYEGGSMEIKYDFNGNMTEMPDKGINKINYNYLNLPDKVNYSRSDNESVVVNTKYTAGGGKLQKENVTTVFGINGYTTTKRITDYLDGFQYLTMVNSTPPSSGASMMMANMETSRAMERQAYSFDNEPSLTLAPLTLKNQGLQFFPTAEGFYDYKKDQYIYQYNDQLGNVRVSFGRNSAGALELVDVNDYYPFGMNHLKSGASFFGVSSYKNYKYNGKELQETGMYDYGARMYMADIGRWGVVDLLAEKHPEMTPLRYSFNNPINATDPTGLLEDWYEDDQTKNIAWHDGSAERKGETNLTQKADGKPLAVIEKNGSGSIINTNMLNNDGSITRNGETITNGYSVTTVTDRTITSRQPWEAVLNADGGEPGQGGNPGFRFPDYYSANISLTIPNPLTGKTFGWNGTLSVDRNFTVYASPWGGALGKPGDGIFSGSLTASWMNQLKTPTTTQLNNFLIGHGISFGGGDVLGGGISYSPGNGTATSLGFYTPQLGLSYNYTPEKLIFNK